MRWIWSMPQVVHALLLYVDEHQMLVKKQRSTTWTSIKCWSRNREAQPFTVEWTTTCDWPQSYYRGMISLSYEIIYVHQAHAILSTELGSKIQSTREYINPTSWTSYFWMLHMYTMTMCACTISSIYSYNICCVQFYLCTKSWI